MGSYLDPLVGAKGDKGDPGSTSPRYVAQSIVAGTAATTECLWINDTGAPVVVSSLYLYPENDVSTDAGNYWLIQVKLGSAPSVNLITVNTSTTPLVSGTPIALGTNVTVGALDAIIIKRAIGAGSPAILGFKIQGRLP